MSPIATATIDSAQTAALDSGDPVAIANALQQATGERPTLRIDITDPPSPVVATVGDVQAEASTADAAVVALGAAAASDAAALPSPTPTPTVVV